MQLVQRLKSNDRGRDFIVGDLHGCLEDLHRLMNHVNFDSAQDRLLSVGDMTDRGPDSPGCLRLLDETWFYAVVGNHERMFADYLMSIDPDTEWESSGAMDLFLYNGGDWATEDPTVYWDQRQQFVQKLRALPLILSVETPDDGIFHVAHGDLMLDKDSIMKDSDIQSLEREVQADEVVYQDMTAERLTDHVVWSRRLIKHPAGHLGIRHSEGLSRVYVGHTIQKTPREIASHVFIDGGAYLRALDPKANGYGLNLLEHCAGTIYRLRGSGVESENIEDLLE